jgi:hypothetical protein
VLRCESVNLRLAEGLSIPKNSLRVFLGERNVKKLITWPQSLDVFSGRGSFLMGLHRKSCRNEEWRRCVGHTATNFKTLPLDVGMHDDQKEYRIIQAPTIAPSTHLLREKGLIDSTVLPERELRGVYIHTSAKRRVCKNKQKRKENSRKEKERKRRKER